MSLHYLMKLEMLIEDVLPLSCYRKKTPEFIPPHLWPPNSPDLNPVNNSMRNVAREGVQNRHHGSGAIDDATDEWLPQ